MGNASKLARLFANIEPRHRLRFRRYLFGALLLLLFGAPFGDAAAETKSYVFSWFYMATYSQDGDCPDGCAVLFFKADGRTIVAGAEA